MVRRSLFYYFCNFQRLCKSSPWLLTLLLFRDLFLCAGLLGTAYLINAATSGVVIAVLPHLVTVILLGFTGFGLFNRFATVAYARFLEAMVCKSMAVRLEQLFAATSRIDSQNYDRGLEEEESRSFGSSPQLNEMWLQSFVAIPRMIVLSLCLLMLNPWVLPVVILCIAFAASAYFRTMTTINLGRHASPKWRSWLYKFARDLHRERTASIRPLLERSIDKQFYQIKMDTNAQHATTHGIFFTIAHGLILVLALILSTTFPYVSALAETAPRPATAGMLFLVVAVSGLASIAFSRFVDGFLALGLALVQKQRSPRIAKILHDAPEKAFGNDEINQSDPEEGELLNEIRLSKASLQLSETLYLRKVNLSIELGEILSITLPGGYESHVLCDMLLDLREPDDGKLLYNGSRQSKKQHLAQQIARIPGNMALIKGSVMDNLCGFNIDANQEVALNYATILGLDRFFIPMDSGYETMVDHNSCEYLPRSIIQKIAIIRTLVTQPQFCILHACDSGFDPIALEQLSHLLAVVKKDRHGQIGFILLNCSARLKKDAHREVEVIDGRLRELSDCNQDGSLQCAQPERRPDHYKEDVRIVLPSKRYMMTANQAPMQPSEEDIQTTDQHKKKISNVV